jgi:ABC-type phosphate transport system permease subunit
MSDDRTTRLKNDSDTTSLSVEIHRRARKDLQSIPIIVFGVGVVVLLSAFTGATPTLAIGQPFDLTVLIGYFQIAILAVVTIPTISVILSVLFLVVPLPGRGENSDQQRPR